MHQRHIRCILLEPDLLDGRLRRSQTFWRRLEALRQLRALPRFTTNECCDSLRTGERARHTVTRVASGDESVRFAVQSADVGDLRHDD